MTHRPQPCVVWIATDGLAVAGKVESTRVKVGDKISLATVSILDRESDGYVTVTRRDLSVGSTFTAWYFARISIYPVPLS